MVTAMWIGSLVWIGILDCRYVATMSLEPSAAAADSVTNTSQRCHLVGSSDSRMGISSRLTGENPLTTPTAANYAKQNLSALIGLVIGFYSRHLVVFL